MKKQLKHQYVVGYHGEKQCVYGPNDKDSSTRYIDRLTLSQARRELKRLSSGTPHQRTIYKLVPVKESRP